MANSFINNYIILSLMLMFIRDRRPLAATKVPAFCVPIDLILNIIQVFEVIWVQPYKLI